MATTLERLAWRLKDPKQDPEGVRILDRLVATLDGVESAFDTKELYDLNGQDFELALDLLRDWRFRRHICSEIGLRASISRLAIDPNALLFS